MSGEIERDPWDDVRASKVHLIIEQSRKVLQADEQCAKATADLNAAHREVGRAMAERDRAERFRAEVTKRVTESIIAYQSLGKDRK